MPLSVAWPTLRGELRNSHQGVKPHVSIGANRRIRNDAVNNDARDRLHRRFPACPRTLGCHLSFV